MHVLPVPLKAEGPYSPALDPRSRDATQTEDYRGRVCGRHRRSPQGRQAMRARVSAQWARNVVGLATLARFLCPLSRNYRRCHKWRRRRATANQNGTFWVWRWLKITKLRNLFLKKNLMQQGLRESFLFLVLYREFKSNFWDNLNKSTTYEVLSVKIEQVLQPLCTSPHHAISFINHFTNIFLHFFVPGNAVRRKSLLALKDQMKKINETKILLAVFKIFLEILFLKKTFSFVLWFCIFFVPFLFGLFVCCK